MKQEQSKKEELEIKKASEELTEQDLERVAGGGLSCALLSRGCSSKCPSYCSSDCKSDCSTN